VIKGFQDADEWISLEEYLIYNDVVYHGSDEDKTKLSFELMDLKGKGQIDLQAYQEFWAGILSMYSELLQTKSVIDADQLKKTNKFTFEQLCHGKSFFTYEDLI